MENQGDQKELFEFDKPKKQLFDLGGVFKKSGFDNSLTLSIGLEKIVFLSIALILLAVVIYALGVESGRSSANRRKAQLSIDPAPKQAPIEKPAPPGRTAHPVAADTAAPARPAEPGKPYTISVGSYENQQFAVDDARKLKAMGFDAFVMKTDLYFVVCAGSFDDKTSAASRQALARIKGIRPGAYFRAR